jgi:hypothetical protein
MTESEFRKFFDELIVIREMLEELMTQSLVVLPEVIHLLVEKRNELNSMN